MKRFIAFALAAFSIGVIACGEDPEPVAPLKQLKSAEAKDLGDSKGSSESKDIAILPVAGSATFYDATGAGTCSYDKTPNDLDVAAMDLPEFGGSAACGACVQVKGPKGTITVRIVDSCPGCAAKDVNLDLSASAFAKIADPKAGHIDMTFATVPCSVSGNIAYHFKEGSSKFWTAIQIRNHKVAIAKVEYKLAGVWTPIERLNYNYFVVKSGVGNQPDGLALRVTSVDGQTLEDTLSGTIVADKTVNGHAQFE